MQQLKIQPTSLGDLLLIVPFELSYLYRPVVFRQVQ